MCVCFNHQWSNPKWNEKKIENIITFRFPLITNDFIVNRWTISCTETTTRQKKVASWMTTFMIHVTVIICPTSEWVSWWWLFNNCALLASHRAIIFAPCASVGPEKKKKKFAHVLRWGQKKKKKILPFCFVGEKKKKKKKKKNPNFTLRGLWWSMVLTFWFIQTPWMK